MRLFSKLFKPAPKFRSLADQFKDYQRRQGVEIDWVKASPEPLDCRTIVKLRLVGDTEWQVHTIEPVGYGELFSACSKYVTDIKSVQGSRILAS